MYSVYGDGVCIYSDYHVSKETKAVNPKLTLEDNMAGSLEITLPMGNAGYDILERMRSEIVVRRDKEEIWSGRIISEKSNFQNDRILTCEGELAYLNDTIQPPCSYENISVRAFLEQILEVHNQKMREQGDARRTFAVGAVNVTDTITQVTNYESTLSCITDMLLGKFGGHIRVRKIDGVRHIDYLKDDVNTNTQEIRFGTNLLDFAKNWDMTKLATAILPRGARQKTSKIAGTDDYLTVEDVNGGSMYVTSEDAIKMYGWIEQMVDWSDITDASELLEKAKEYLQDTRFVDMVIELSAVDMHYLSDGIEPIKLLDKVRCISKPHGMDRFFAVTKLSIQLDKPDSAKYTLGGTVQTTLTGSTSSVIKDVEQKLPNTILQSAKENASYLINMATNGFITITKDTYGAEALIISDTRDYTIANRYWKWNVNGLGYWSKNQSGSSELKTAITMDGAIVADFITTGVLSTVLIRDEDGNSSWNLKTGEFTMRHGSIVLGQSRSFPNGRFRVNDDGEIYAEYGEIGGFVIDADSIHNDVMHLNSAGLDFYQGGDRLGMYGTQYWAKQPRSKGMTVSMEHDTAYIAWAYKELSSNETYTIKMMYTSESLPMDDGDTFAADRMHVACDFDLNGYDVYNFWLDPDRNCGVNKGMLYNDGKIIEFQLSNGGTLRARIVNGFILGV